MQLSKLQLLLAVGFGASVFYTAQNVWHYARPRTEYKNDDGHAHRVRSDVELLKHQVGALQGASRARAGAGGTRTRPWTAAAGSGRSPHEPTQEVAASAVAASASAAAASSAASAAAAGSSWRIPRAPLPPLPRPSAALPSNDARGGVFSMPRVARGVLSNMTLYARLMWFIGTRATPSDLALVEKTVETLLEAKDGRAGDTVLCAGEGGDCVIPATGKWKRCSREIGSEEGGKGKGFVRTEGLVKGTFTMTYHGAARGKKNLYVVRFGIRPGGPEGIAGGPWLTTFANEGDTIRCAADTFGGDPAHGKPKECWIDCTQPLKPKEKEVEDVREREVGMCEGGDGARTVYRAGHVGYFMPVHPVCGDGEGDDGGDDDGGAGGGGTPVISDEWLYRDHTGRMKGPVTRTVLQTLVSMSAAAKDGKFVKDTVVMFNDKRATLAEWQAKQWLSGGDRNDKWLSKHRHAANRNTNTRRGARRRLQTDTQTQTRSQTSGPRSWERILRSATRPLCTSPNEAIRDLVKAWISCAYYESFLAATEKTTAQLLPPLPGDTLGHHQWIDRAWVTYIKGHPEGKHAAMVTNLIRSVHMYSRYPIVVYVVDTPKLSGKWDPALFPRLVVIHTSGIDVESFTKFRVSFNFVRLLHSSATPKP